MNDLLLSIGITSCDHEKWIEGTVRSILDQQTDFSFEIIICDDASTDNTIPIIENLARNHSNKIQLLLSEKRLGPLQNGKRFFERASGKYLSWLDADDRWTHPHKIQEQLSFLEKNPDYKGCFHDATIVSNHQLKGNEEHQMRFHSEWKTYSQFNTYRGDFHVWDALQRNIIPTASLVFRREELQRFFNTFSDHRLSISWAVHLWLLRNGKFKYFNEPWSEYRDHDLGFSKKYGLIDFKINNINILEKILKLDDFRGVEKDIYRALVNEIRHLLCIPGVSNIGKLQFKNYLSLYKKYQRKFARLEANYFSQNFENKMDQENDR